METQWQTHMCCKWAVLLSIVQSSVVAPQTSFLRQKISDIAAQARGTVAVACSLPGIALDCDLNSDAKAPMQSVFKLPLALAVLHKVEQGSLSLDQHVRFRPDDRILPQTYSPLQEKHPSANVDVPLEELLRLAVSQSDNVAADILLRIIGGPKTVTDYVASLGVSGFHLEDGEQALHEDQTAQYRNWFTARAAVQLLRRIADRPPLSPDHTALLLGWMQASVKPRLEADLPSGTSVAHKAGTSGVDAGIAHATNDIGLITLPDGRRLAIAVFVTDSRAGEAAREKVISLIARAAYDAAVLGVVQGSLIQEAAADAALEAFARQALHDVDAIGFIHVRDVSSGRVLAHVTSAESDQGNGLGIDSPVLPLSVIKVYLAAVWLEHRFGSTKVDCVPSANKLVRHMLIDDVLISGCDSAAGEMAVIVRKKLGASEVLRDLDRYGIENLTLKPDASDSEWSRFLSLGEDQVKTTPRQLSAFMLAIGQGGGKLLSAATGERLAAALEAVVQDGTATSIKSALNNTGWHIASLLRDPHHARYVILVFIQGRGLGGGFAARTAVSTAQFLAAREQSSATKSPH